jgi:O-antigen/teichoic acid export membrane protein
MRVSRTKGVRVADKRTGASLIAVAQSITGRVLFTLITAGTGIITARALHPSGRGELAALGVWPNFLGNAMTLGLPSSLIFWSRKDPDNASDVLWVAFPLSILLGIIATIVGFVGIPFWLAQYPPGIIHLARIFMLNAVIVLFTSVAQAGIQARQDFFASSFAPCLTQAISLILLAALQMTGSMTPVRANTAYVLGGIPTCAYLLTRLRPTSRWLPSRIRLSCRRLLSYGIRSYGVDLCGTLALYADQAIVVRLLSPEAMGTYVVALSLSRMVDVVHTSVAAVLFPKAVALGTAELLSLTGRCARSSTLLTFICGAGVALLGPALLSLLYGREYRNATIVLNLLIAECIVSGATLVLTRSFMSIGRPGLVTMLQSSGLLLSVPLLLLFIPRWGIVGAGAALLVASTARLALTLMSFRIVLHHRIPSLLPKLSEILGILQQVKAALSGAVRPASGSQIAKLVQ